MMKRQREMCLVNIDAPCMSSAIAVSGSAQRGHLARRWCSTHCNNTVCMTGRDGQNINFVRFASMEGRMLPSCTREGSVIPQRQRSTVYVYRPMHRLSVHCVPIKLRDYSL